MESKAVQPADIPAKLRELAAVIRNDPTARDAIAEVVEIMADVMDPCIDCHQTHDMGDDAPNVGQDGGIA